AADSGLQPECWQVGRPRLPDPNVGRRLSRLRGGECRVLSPSGGQQFVEIQLRLVNRKAGRQGDVRWLLDAELREEPQLLGLGVVRLTQYGDLRLTNLDLGATHVERCRCADGGAR